MIQYSIERINQQKWTCLFVKTFEKAAKSQSEKKKATFIENVHSQILEKNDTLILVIVFYKIKYTRWVKFISYATKQLKNKTDYIIHIGSPPKLLLKGLRGQYWHICLFF